MFSRCKPGLGMHTLTKSPDEMKTALASTMQHHGATLVIDAIDPVGTMDSRVYDQVGELFSFQERYEPYFTGEMVEEVGLYYGLRSRPQTTGISSLSCCTCAAKTLIRSHIPFGVTGSFHTLEAYKIIAAPVLSEMEDKDNDRLVDYVRNGGTLYLSGCGNAALVEALTGNRFVQMTEEKTLYLAPQAEFESVFCGFNARYPLPFEQAAPVVTPGNVRVIATLTFPYTKPNEIRYASIHSDPPGVPTGSPMLVIRPYGKGTVIWSAACLEGVAMDEYRDIFLGLLLKVRGDMPFSLHSNAPASVEFTLFESEGEKLVTAVHMCNDAAVPTLPGFEVRVRTEKQPCEVLLLPERTPVPFAYENGETVFHARNLHIWDMYQIVK